MSIFPVVTVEDFPEQVQGAQELLLIDFFTADCIPCRKQEPMLAAVAAELDGRLQVLKVDAAASPELAQRYGVRGVPALLLFRQGEVVDRKSGFMPAGELRRWLKPYVEEESA